VAKASTGKSTFTPSRVYSARSSANNLPPDWHLSLQLTCETVAEAVQGQKDLLTVGMLDC
jgi:hypothetical protein